MCLVWLAGLGFDCQFSSHLYNSAPCIKYQKPNELGNFFSNDEERGRLKTTISCKWDIWGASLVAQTVKNLPTMRETWVQSLGCEDPLEEGMATHSSILAWSIPMDTVHGLAKSWI